MNTTLAGLVSELRAVTKNPYLVAIDGPSGAGKSTLSDAIASKLPAVIIVRKDDFYRVMSKDERVSLTAEQGYRRNFDWQRLERQVLQPLVASQVAHYQRYDWVTESLAETLTVHPAGIVIVEGVGSTRPELRHYYDLRIWVETNDGDGGSGSLPVGTRWTTLIVGQQPSVTTWKRSGRGTRRPNSPG